MHCLCNTSIIPHRRFKGPRHGYIHHKSFRKRVVPFRRPAVSHMFGRVNGHRKRVERIGRGAKQMEGSGVGMGWGGGEG